MSSISRPNPPNSNHGTTEPLPQGLDDFSLTDPANPTISSTPILTPPLADDSPVQSPPTTRPSTSYSSPEAAIHSASPESQTTRDLQSSAGTIEGENHFRQYSPQDHVVQHGEKKPNKSERSNGSGTSERSKTKRDRDKKQMIATALSRAQEAVDLDNSHKYFEAIQAYEEACDYLGFVLRRSTSEDDQKKLLSIRETYSTRVEDLRMMSTHIAPGLDEKPLPAPKDEPEVRPSLDGVSDEDEGAAILGTATVTRILDTPSSPTVVRTPQSETIDLAMQHSPFSPNEAAASDHTRAESDLHPTPLNPSNAKNLAIPGETNFIPRPLSPRRLIQDEQTIQPPVPEAMTITTLTASSGTTHRSRGSSSGLGSWLHSRNASTSSSRSSHHSLSSVHGRRKKHIRLPSGNTEAEFDAALDAAVEAAYNDGYEPYLGDDIVEDDLHSSQTITPRTEPADAVVGADHQRNIGSQNSIVLLSDEPNDLDGEMDAATEENIISLATQDMAGEGLQHQFAYRQPVKQLDPADRSIENPMEEPVLTARLADGQMVPSAPRLQPPNLPPLLPPPTIALPPPPPPPPPPPQSSLPTPSHSIVPPVNATKFNLVPPQPAGIQERRLSSQKAKKLKIETTIAPKLPLQPLQTSNLIPSPNRPPPKAPVPLPKTEMGVPRSAALLTPQMAQKPSSSSLRPEATSMISSPYPSPYFAAFPAEIKTAISLPTPELDSAISVDSIHMTPDSAPVAPVDHAFSEHSLPLRSVKSSGTVRNRGAMLSPTPDTVDHSPGATVLRSYSPGQRVPWNTPMVATFNASAAPAPPLTQGTADGIFADHLHRRGTPSVDIHNVPRALEPCPESALLRPFWLMRCIYQAIAHPRGAYVSNRLFIPREIWRTKHVKLKALDDKVAQCDLLTAALQNLRQVDSFDAQAMLDEMQNLEAIFDQVQANLIKKLGSDVGPQHASSLFKDAPPESSVTVVSPDSDRPSNSLNSSNSHSSKTGSKGYLSSWRKLRSKGSNANLAGLSRDGSKPTGGMNSVPMTSSIAPSTRFTHTRHRIEEFKTEGPYATYMGALAKLCDAAQVLDQVTRQVEDPGLKKSSQAYVGLELCTRHASEFFAFYICRFILQDITMLADKFVKRAGEWVLS